VGAAAAAAAGKVAPACMNWEVSKANSSNTFCTSVSISASSSDSSKPSSINSSVISARAISFRMSSIVCCSSGTFMSRFISFMTPADIFKELAVDMEAIAVVKCRLTAAMEHFVRSNLVMDFLDRTTCFAKVRTLCT